MAHNSENPPFEYNQITEYIFIGTSACCIDHFKNELLNKGVTADISLQKEHLDAPYGVKTFLWLPTEDHTPPTQQQLFTGVNTISALIVNKEKIYIHCLNGHGRAPTLTAAYLIYTGMTTEEAIAFIKERRPVIHLEDSQIEALHQFEESC